MPSSVPFVRVITKTVKIVFVSVCRPCINGILFTVFAWSPLMLVERMAVVECVAFWGGTSDAWPVSVLLSLGVCYCCVAVVLCHSPGGLPPDQATSSSTDRYVILFCLSPKEEMSSLGVFYRLGPDIPAPVWCWGSVGSVARVKLVVSYEVTNSVPIWYSLSLPLDLKFLSFSLLELSLIENWRILVYFPFSFFHRAKDKYHDFMTELMTMIIHQSAYDESASWSPFISSSIMNENVNSLGTSVKWINLCL